MDDESTVARVSYPNFEHESTRAIMHAPLKVANTFITSLITRLFRVMTRIKKIVVSNFKSWEGIADIDFGGDYFSAIIGPNGVGKSNLMDAISFVLGMGHKVLRTKNINDLIWRNPEDEAIQVPNSFVEAHVISDDSTLVFRRQLTRDEQPSYYLNEQEVTAEEYKTRLVDAGFSQDNYSLIFQGSVEQMASKTPLQLSEMIENLSGSIKFKAEYTKLNNRLDKLREKVGDIGRARAKKLGLVKALQRSQEAKEKRRKEDAQLEKLGFKECILRVAQTDARIARCQQDIKEIKKERKIKEKAASASEKNLLKLRRELADAIKAIQDLEQKSRSLSSSLKSAQTTITALGIQSDNAMEETENLTPQIQFNQTELKQIETDLGRARKELSTAEKGYAKLETETKQEVLELTPELEQLYEECQRRFDVETSLEQTEIDLLNQKVELVEQELKLVDSQSLESNSRKDHLLTQYRHCEAKYEESKERILRIEERIETNIVEMSTCTTKLEETCDSISATESELKLKTLLLKEMNKEKRLSDKRNALLENVQRLKRKHEGVVGVLYTLIQPKEERFATALDLILGSNFDAVVVKSMRVAQECIKTLRKENLGVMTFLPLDSLDTKPIDSSLRSYGACRLAIDAVTFDRSNARAVAYACSDALICDSSEVANDLKWKKNVKAKLVTLSGLIYHSNNIMTIGNSVSRQNRFDKTKAVVLHQQVLNLVNVLKELRIQEGILREQQEQLAVHVEKSKATSSQIKEDLEMSKITLKALSRELEGVEEQIISRNSHENELKNQVEGYHSKIRDISRQFEDRRHKAFDEFSKTAKVDINEFQTARRKLIKLHKDRDEQLTRLNDEISYLETKRSDSMRRIAYLEARNASYEEKLNRCQKRIQDMKEESEIQKQERIESEEEIKTLEAKVENLNTNLESLESYDTGDFDLLEEKQENIEKDLGSLEHQRDLIIESSNIKYDNDEVELEADKALEKYRTYEALKKQLETVQSKIYDINAERTQTSMSDFAEISLQEAEGQLEDISSELRKAQKDFATAERDLDVIRRKRREAFLTVFTPIRRDVESIYKELTTTKIDPLGGTARLNPKNESEPYKSGIIYSAMPPRKPYSDIDSLSGGEKTIAALSLIFALNRYRMSPVYILDEVDAALDYSNVEMVARYIQKCAREHLQFIVISLKLWFYEHADNLLGVYRSSGSGSKLLSYSLTEEGVA